MAFAQCCKAQAKEKGGQEAAFWCPRGLPLPLSETFLQPAAADRQMTSLHLWEEENLLPGPVASVATKACALASS